MTEEQREKNRAKARRSYAKHREKNLERNRRWRKAHPSYSKAWASKNRAKSRAATRRWQQRNPEKCAEGQRLWRTRHPEESRAGARLRSKVTRAERRVRDRARDATMRGAGSHTAADILNQLKAQRRRCFYCGRRLGTSYHVDHVWPVSKGGRNSRDNLVIACAGCNLAKGAKDPQVFAGMLL